MTERLLPGLRILLGVPGPPAPHPTPRVPDAANVAEWEAIARQAVDNGLALPLHRRLRMLGLEERLPEPVRRALQATVTDQVARNLLLIRELTTILKACEHGGVPCVALRGPALAEHLHGDPTARPMGDLDLLVERQRLGDLARILIRLGFSEVEHRRNFARTFSYTLSFRKDRPLPLIVEPHWTLAYPPFTDVLDMAPIWARCRRHRVVGVESWSLSPEDLLFHLCLHLLHAGGSAPLLWYVELDGAIRWHAQEINWSYLFALAERGGQQPLIAAVLDRLRDDFDCPLPAEARLIVTQRNAEAGAGGRLRRGLLDLLTGGSTLSGREEFALFYSMRGIRPRLTYAASLLFPSAEFMYRHYGSRSRWRLCLCYAARAIRILVEGGRWVSQLVHHSVREGAARKWLA